MIEITTGSLVVWGYKCFYICSRYIALLCVVYHQVYPNMPYYMEEHICGGLYKMFCSAAVIVTPPNVENTLKPLIAKCTEAFVSTLILTTGCWHILWFVDCHTSLVFCLFFGFPFGVHSLHEILKSLTVIVCTWQNILPGHQEECLRLNLLHGVWVSQTICLEICISSMFVLFNIHFSKSVMDYEILHSVLLNPYFRV